MDDNRKDDNDGLVPLSTFLPALEKDAIPVYRLDGTVDYVNIKPPSVDVDDHWITAIQKVSSKSSSFWYDYGRRYNEKIIMRIRRERGPHGERCCDVLVYSRRSIVDVVSSAWNEYNKYLVKG
jgi:hypothetical protein